MKLLILPIALFQLILSSCSSNDQKQHGIDTTGATSNLQLLLDSAEKGHPIEIVKTYLNNDTILDYFIVSHFGLSHGEFYNGKDSSEIQTDGVTQPWSRPGIELKHNVINVDCTDGQNEILVKGGSGGTSGLILTLEIYRFDVKSKRMKLIFEEVIEESYHSEVIGELPEKLHLITLKGFKDSCVQFISVRPGKYKKGNDTLGEGIIPIPKGKEKKYQFNKDANAFDEI